jgi:hypothetical protein
MVVDRREEHKRAAILNHNTANGYAIGAVNNLASSEMRAARKHR